MLKAAAAILWLWPVSVLATAVPTYLPVPPQAVGPALNTDGYRVEAFGGGSYMVTDNKYQSMVLVSTHGVIVVDAPVSIGYGLLYAIGNITDIPITHYVYSHSHADHTGATYILPSNAKRISHSLTKGYLAAEADSHRPLPEPYHGPNHHPGNIYIYAPVQKVLMLVDIYDFNHYIGGHLTRSGNRKDVENSRDYALDLKANCIEAFLLGASPPNATNPISGQVILPEAEAANPDNPNAWIRTALVAFADYCGNKTNTKWQNILAGTDVWGAESAFRMVDSMRLEFDVQGPFGS
ncbi:hypothetical protein GQ53DRAFT_852702 [Thozetella sp. PMI_491]|nr:hypothetical protein GQ53DRAFT_852702 [Thozetella sp. PMI_491]